MTDELKKLWLEQSNSFASAKTMDEARPRATSTGTLASLCSQDQEALELWCAGMQQGAESLGLMVYWTARLGEVRAVTKGHQKAATVKSSASRRARAAKAQGRSAQKADSSRYYSEAEHSVSSILARWAARVKSPQVEMLYSFRSDDIAALAWLNDKDLLRLASDCYSNASSSHLRSRDFWMAQKKLVLDEQGKRDRGRAASKAKKKHSATKGNAKKKKRSVGIGAATRRLLAGPSGGQSMAVRASIIGLHGTIGKTKR